MVERNRRKMDPFLPSAVAVLMQLIATMYLYSTEQPLSSVISSGILTCIYAFVGYLLNKKP